MKTVHIKKCSASTAQSAHTVYIRPMVNIIGENAKVLQIKKVNGNGYI